MSLKESSVGKIVRGGFWLYVSNVVGSLAGFAYWLVISAIAGAEVLGITSAVVGLVNLVAGVINLGVGAGCQRFFGLCLGRCDEEGLRAYFWSTTIFTIFTHLSASSVLLALWVMDANMGTFTSDMLFLASIILFFQAFVPFQSLLISLLKTDVIFYANIAGNALKFVVGVALVALGFGWFGAGLGYAVVGIASSIVTVIYCLRIVGLRPVWRRYALSDVLKAGFASWLPYVIVTLGQWLGVLMVFGIAGAVETGHYYVALAIASMILMIATSLASLLLPVLSSMEDGRKRVAGRVLRMSLAFMVPVAIFTGLYPWIPLSLLGQQYLDASPVLSVLLLACVPIALSSCVSSLLYAYSRYDLVLLVGLAQNLPSMASYFILVPRLGGLGAAISYALGHFTGLVATMFASKLVNFSLDFKGLARVLAPPLVAGFACRSLGAHWALALIVIALLSLLSYAKLRVISRSELREIVHALFSKEVADRLGGRTRLVLDLLYGPRTAPRNCGERSETAERDEELRKGS
jgi:O-antigen/teichoic acid export membrane protein